MSASTESHAQHAHDLMASANKWIIAFTVMFGAFISVMDISVVNVALPHMMGTFGEDLSSITWVATGYSIAEIIMVTMTGWWSTMIGRKRLYLLSFGVFTAGSVLCGSATTYPMMLVCRVLQGAGGGALIPVSQAILRETFPPEEQGMAMAMYGMGVVLAPAFGPILGGWLTDHYGWPWIFYINVPVSLLGMFLVATFVHDPPYLRRGVQKVDWWGIGLLALSLTMMQIVLERGQENDWFESKWIVAGSIVTVVSLITLIIYELKIPEPVVNFRVLRDLPLTLGSAMSLIFGIGLFGTTFILPQFTQNLLGYTAFDAGLVLAPRAVAILMLMPIAGWLYRHFDARVMIFFGIVLICWSYWDLSHLSLEADFWTLVPMLLLMGAGMPFMFVTMTTVSLSTTRREDMTDASGIYTLSRRVGGNIGYALIATLVARGQQIHRTTLVSHITDFNPNFMAFKQHLAAGLAHAGVAPGLIPRATMGYTDFMVHRHATMLAYNDASLITGLLFLITVPLVFLIPGRAVLAATAKKNGAAGH